MSPWSKDELRKIAETGDLHILPFREDGLTYGTPTWIWSVVVDGNLHVRAYNGTNSSWHQAATEQQPGRIVAGGLTKEVAFETVEGQIDDRIDDAYRAKYQSSPYLKPMISTRARSATVRVIPRLVSAPSQFLVIGKPGPGAGVQRSPYSSRRLRRIEAFDFSTVS